MRSYLILLLSLVIPIVCTAQDEMSDDDSAAMIASAVSAAPASLSDSAAVMDWEHNVLREGSNGFTCFPDNPETDGNDPACLDSEWIAFFGAWMNKEEYKPSGYGIGYMLVGSSPNSNTDPFAEGPTDDNEWMTESMPHVMVIVPDPSTLDGMNTDPSTGTPFVMWRGTDMAHVMMPMPGQ